LAKDRGGHLVNQPRYHFLASVEKQQLDMTSNNHNEKKNKK